MGRIITPVQYKTVPWKNGLGQTTEMAINENGTLECFDWRISQAHVAQDGAFSSFAGYDRHLVLLEGNGMLLEHGSDEQQRLTKPLDIAVFDGGADTKASLLDGAITDFNVMTKKGKYEVQVTTCIDRKTVELPVGQLCFVYCLDAEAIVKPSDLRLPPIHLLQISAQDNDGLAVTGERMIVVCLKSVQL